MSTGKLENAAFQNYAVTLALGTCQIPDEMAYEAAAVIPTGFSTAAGGLYMDDYLGLPHPSTTPQKSGKAILVWGGSSSVGSSVIQLATASGLDVITTASEKNFELCKKLGARDVFDYRSPTVVEDVIAALSKGQVVGAFDCKHLSCIINAQLTLV